jgi:hypothetical protein
MGTVRKRGGYGVLALLALLAGCQATAPQRSTQPSRQPWLEPRPANPETFTMAHIEQVTPPDTRPLIERTHPTVRLLLAATGHEAEWVEHATFTLPAASCAAAVGFTPASEHDCALVALGKGAAILMMREPGCSGELCSERSWAFMRPYRVPLPLPARRSADFRALRAELSREQATALWLAGFRGASDRRLAADPYVTEAELAAITEELPTLAEYTSCAVAPDESELLCRSTRGDVVGIDAASGMPRIVAWVDAETGARSYAHDRVFFTDNGELAMHVRASQHPLCDGDTCELIGLISWPSPAPALAHLVRPDSLPY